MTTYLSDGEVTQHEVMAWAQEQAKFLSPTQTLVLWYLCINAWHTPTNPEGAHAGQVLSGRTVLRKIQLNTGLSDKAVRDALNALQDEGYVWRKSLPGNGQSQIAVFWSAGADERREEFRAGVRDLPEGFKRTTPKTKKRHLTAVSEGNVVAFRSGTSHHNDRR